VLTNPDIKGIAAQFFSQHLPPGQGQRIVFADLKKVLKALNQKCGVPVLSSQEAEKLFKRFDFDGDGAMGFEEFYELFVSSLRRSAFDVSSLMGRNVFVTQQTGKVWDAYEQVRKLGTGSFGAAFLCKHKLTGDERVVKSVEKSQVKLPVEDIEREIMVMLQIDHPNVVRLYEWYEGSTSIYLVLDALKGGTLKEVIINNFQTKGRPVAEDWSRKVIYQVLQAMAYVHSLRLIHKDLKDENVMLLKQEQDYDEPFVVIIDLGVSEMFPSSDPYGKLVGGTPTTMAPEVWMNDFGPKCDVWSVGCILYELLTGAMPFVARSMEPKDWMALHKRGPDWSRVQTSEHGRRLCKVMLTYNDSKRPSMAECLEHEWFATPNATLKSVTPAQFSTLKSFHRESALKRSLLCEIATRLPMERAERIVKMFKAFDTNADGRLSKQELKAAFSRMGVTDELLMEKTFNALDIDGDGVLGFTEFAMGVLLMFQDLVEERFRALFRRYDKDGDGKMTREELQAFLGNATHAHLATKEARKKPDEIVGGMFSQSKTISYEDVRRKVFPCN